MDTTTTTIKYDDFAKLDLRVATVIECRPHVTADKLLILQIEWMTQLHYLGSVRDDNQGMTLTTRMPSRTPCPEEHRMSRPPPMTQPRSRVDLYAAIRRDARSGMSNRALQRKHGVGECARILGEAGMDVVGQTGDAVEARGAVHRRGLHAGAHAHVEVSGIQVGGGDGVVDPAFRLVVERSSHRKVGHHADDLVPAFEHDIRRRHLSAPTDVLDSAAERIGAAEDLVEAETVEFHGAGLRPAVVGLVHHEQRRTGGRERGKFDGLHRVFAL